MSHKSEMAGPLNRGDTIINKHFTFTFIKMPTTVFILTFISMINTTSERLEVINLFICRYFSFYLQLKFRAQLS